MKTTPSLGRRALPAGEATTVDLLVRFGAEDDAPQARRPLNLSLVLDRSGSMGGRKLAQAIRASKLLVDRLGERDTLSVVTYDDTVRTVQKPTKVTDRKAIKDILGKVRAGGITNLSGGWLEGCGHVRKGRDEISVDRVMMLTDGQANMGVTDPRKLVGLAREQAEAGVVTTTLGFGNGFNEDLLIGMADAAGGNFYFIQSPEDAEEVFRIEVEGLSSVIARELTATVRPAGGVTITEVLSSARYGAKDGVYDIHVGEVYAIEPRTLALTLTLPAFETGDATLATVELAWQTAEGDTVVERTAQLAITAAVVSPEEAAQAGEDPAVVRACSKLRIGRAKEEAIGLADKGQLAKASEKLRAMAGDIKTRALDEQFEFAEEVDQLEHYAGLFDKGQYGNTYRKEIVDQSYQARKRGRGDLKLRGATSGNTSGLDAVTAAEGEEPAGVIVRCVKEGGKLRVKVASDGFDPTFNVQFPRSLRQEGARYLVEAVEPSSNGTFYRATGDIKLLLRPGESRPGVGGGTSRRGALKKTKAMSLADVPTIDDVGDGVLIQIVKAGSKLRARVVSDDYDPNKNMRFPRAIRQEGLLFVVEDVKPSSDGSYYIPYGKIHRLVQPA